MGLSKLNFDAFFALPRRKSKHAKKSTPAHATKPPPPSTHLPEDANTRIVPDALRRISSGPNPYGAPPKSRGRGGFFDRSRSHKVVPQVALSEHGDYNFTRPLPRAPARSPRSPRYKASVHLEGTRKEEEEDEDKGSLRSLKTFLQKSQFSAPQPATETFPLRKNIPEDRKRRSKPVTVPASSPEKDDQNEDDDRSSLKNLKTFINNTDLLSDKPASRVSVSVRPNKIDKKDIKVPATAAEKDDNNDDDDRGSLSSLKLFMQKTDVLSNKSQATAQVRRRSYQRSYPSKSFARNVSGKRTEEDKGGVDDEDDRGSVKSLKAYMNNTGLYSKQPRDRSSLPVTRKIDHPDIKLPADIIDNMGSLKDFSTVYKREGKFERKARSKSLLNNEDDEMSSLKNLKEFAQSTQLCSPTASPTKKQVANRYQRIRGSGKGNRKSLVLQDYIDNDDDDKGSLKDLKEFAQSTQLCSPKKLSPQKRMEVGRKGSRKSLVLQDYINNDEDDKGSLKDLKEFAQNTELCSPKKLSPHKRMEVGRKGGRKSLVLQDYINNDEDDKGSLKDLKDFARSTELCSPPVSPSGARTGMSFRRGATLDPERVSAKLSGSSERESVGDREFKGLPAGSRRRRGARIRSSLTSQQEFSRTTVHGAVEEAGSLQNIKNFMDGSDFVRSRKCNGKEIGRRNGANGRGSRPASLRTKVNVNMNNHGEGLAVSSDPATQCENKTDDIAGNEPGNAPPTSPVSSERTHSNESDRTTSGDISDKIDLLSRLTKEEADIMVYKGSEVEYSGKYNNFFPVVGTFHCKACGQALYSAAAKFDSKTGYPSFDCCYNNSVKSYGFRKRYTLKCSGCLGHLGHLFEGEWLTATNERHSVNSLCLTYNSSPQPEDLPEVTLRSNVEV